MEKNKIFLQIIIISALFLLWYLIVIIFNVPEYIFPGPLAVLNSWIENKRVILSNAAITFEAALLGFLIANLTSVIIALFVCFHRELENTIMPVAIVVKTIPVIALVPLLIIWLGSGLFSKIAAAALVCFFPALVNVLEGVKVLDKKMVWLFKVYAANKFQLITKLIFPSILPYLFAALKTSSSLAVVGALVGEFIGSNKGLGFIIISNYYNMNTSLVFAAIITSSIIGIFFYYLIHFLEKKITFGEERIIMERDRKAPTPYKYLERR
ncbi:ABC transporter permease [Patescibacteria group bacterium]|nr:ABC transporter permease [Patescibacteria group bacterium]MBU4367816.1 ABC transporter permease [Patescibacteria group bacterium]MBU4461526.1 ABC transporter permease [Patescibacteria group bacterium]MCG2700333.1 ABC transporter permease [Candidatus Parcubacteria bacterium]